MGPLSPLSWALIVLTLLRLAVTVALSRAQSLTVARHREAVPKAFADVLTVAAHHRAADYTRAKETINRKAAVWDACVLLGWTLLGGLAAIDGWATQMVGGKTALQHSGPLVCAGCLTLVAFSAINGLSDLPASLWRTFKVEQRFGFNRTTLKVFVLDQVKGALLGMGIGLPLWAAILVCLRDPSPYAWMWAWGIYAVLSLLLVWAGPRFIAPLFNTFRPLDDPSIKERIDGLMQRCGYRYGGLYVMDGSARSTHGNAYFTGLGRSKRVVFFDTLMQTLTAEEIEGVLAHELGHFALGHIQKQLMVSLAVSAVVFYAASCGLRADGLYAAMGFAGAALPTKLIGLMILAGLGSFWLTPLLAYLSRRREYEADAYACRWADAAALQRALLKLFVDNGATLTPNGVYAAFYSSHPPAVDRLAALARAGC